MCLILLLATAVFFLFFNNEYLADPNTRVYYHELKQTLLAKGYESNLIVICTKRFHWQNSLLVKYNNAATKSRHLCGDAIDILVFDVNNDGNADKKDVDVVYHILDKEIIGNKGGIGTYKNEKSFFNRQMVHFENRGTGSRWHE